MPKAYAALYVVAVRIHHPVYGTLGSVIDALRHWKIWLHTSDDEDFFIHLHINDKEGHVALQQDKGWDADERKFVLSHHSLLFLGVTRQSVDEIADAAKEIIDNWGIYKPLDNNCQGFVVALRPEIKLLPEDKWARLGEPNKSLNAIFPEMDGYKPATGHLRKLLSEEYAAGPRGTPSHRGATLSTGKSGQPVTGVPGFEQFPSDVEIVQMIHEELWGNEVVPLPDLPNVDASTVTLATDDGSNSASGFLLL